jgi:hypothetical protein
MEQAELDHLRQQFSSEVHKRFPGAPLQRVEVLQYGDDPEIEPGQILGRVVLDVPADLEQEERGRRLEDFHDAHRDAIRQLRQDLDKMPAQVALEFVIGGEPKEGGGCAGPKMKLMRGPRGFGAGGEGPLTPVMARLGPEDLEILDTLITTGIAASRAEAVRWALTRIRERPAYEQLRARAREIDELKTQF